MNPERIYLSPPHLNGNERVLLEDALRSGWIAPLGPHVDGFEREFAEIVEVRYAVATISGTAALHLALRLVGVQSSDSVIVSTLTFVASVNPIRYLGATPIFVDSERRSWNMEPGLLEEVLRTGAKRGRLPAAVILVHLYGQTADVDPIVELCREFDVPLVEDAAEALGSDYRGMPPGRFGVAGAFSFNGNKIVTTSGGGMLVTNHTGLQEHARKLATQARDPAPHYEHSELGYNYRLSNVLAALGRAQLQSLEARVQARRAIHTRYVDGLGDLEGVTFQPEAEWGRHTRWLTCVLIDPRSGTDRETIRSALERENIESRPLWKPMHLQPLYRSCPIHGGEIAEHLFDQGLCLPSGSTLSEQQQERVIEIVRTTILNGRARGK